MINRRLLTRFLLAGYIFTSVFLFLYSYTQVDLNLTMSRVNLLQAIQKAFQYIGFFQRPLSTFLFLTIVIMMFLLYALAIFGIKSGMLSQRSLWKIILCCSIILFFTFPAFSYDYFNYMFTAKTVVVYHQNPYLIKPIDLSGIDPWLSFMRWTHLPSAYTPLWILLSLPAYILGFNNFLLTVFSFKILFVGFYLLTVWGVMRIFAPEGEKEAALGMAVFALNPLVLVESVVSPHNDIVLAALALVSYLIYLKKNRFMAMLVLAFSIAIKMMSLIMIPAMFFRWNRKLLLLLMSFAVVIGFMRKELLPWYFLWVMPFVALSYSVRYVVFFYSAVSLGLLLRYAPYLYYGDYNGPVNMLRNTVFSIPIILAVIIISFDYIRHRFAKTLPFAPR